MNREKILQLAAHIEKGTHKFNGITAAFQMNNWLYRAEDTVYNNDDGSFDGEAYAGDNIVAHFNETEKNAFTCNTTACLAGWTCLLFAYDEFSDTHGHADGDHIVERAIEILEITPLQAENLFTTHTSPRITGKAAAEVLRRFVKDGSIQWNEVLVEHGIYNA